MEHIFMMLNKKFNNHYFMPYIIAINKENYVSSRHMTGFSSS